MSYLLVYLSNGRIVMMYFYDNITAWHSEFTDSDAGLGRRIGGGEAQATVLREELTVPLQTCVIVVTDFINLKQKENNITYSDKAKQKRRKSFLN